MNFEQWRAQSAPGAFRLFSLGRHALVEALRAAGIGPGNKVLLPEFICRDVLASLNSVGAETVWYPVGEDLCPASVDGTWPAASAVLAVNYFGFPQPLEPFRAYAARTGALIIEDNAHGFLSRDDEGDWLGTRADAGIFSLRKSLPLADGAALFVPPGPLTEALSAPIAPAGAGYAPGGVLKARLRSIPVIGVLAANIVTGLLRLTRQVQHGHAVPPAAESDEHLIPYPPAAHVGLSRRLAALDVEREIERRRDLYRASEAAARSFGIRPLFSALPRLVAPYGFPFRSTDEVVLDQMRHWALRRGIELIHWPDLPQAVEKKLPACHHNLWLVNFI